MNFKYSFLNDYSEGAHPKILKTLEETNLNQEMGYGEDSICLEAANLIKEKIGNSNVDVHFVTGGTQANLIVLSAILKPYESVISPSEGHINTHEAGSIEATGHKINSIVREDGKLKPEEVLEVVKVHEDEHMVKPKVVFISNSTEVGTVYTKSELEALSKICRENNLYLYLDGARLGSALTTKNSDLTLADIAKLVDVFYIGGTKNGALLGEAIILVNDELKPNFRRVLKQKGALLAKGRLLGAQFLELFKDDLYFDLAKHANEMAEKLSTGISDLGYKFLTNSPTNQIFPIFPNKLIDKLKEIYGFYVWSKVDPENSSIRLVTSWATKEEKVDEFLKDLKSLHL
jgi:threonine aldolase